MKKKPLRPLGKVLLDMEPLIEELMVGHDLQWSDFIGLMHLYLQVHFPAAQETYTTDGEHPVLYYGPREGLK